MTVPPKLRFKLDEVIYEACRRERRALVPLDRGFGDPRRHPASGSAGIIVLRPASQAVADVRSLLVRLLPLLQAQPLEAALWIVESERVRIRRRDT
ncbi:MAG: DUF5615 family PIN-like protein [Planctomycetota bacterium]